MIYGLDAECRLTHSQANPCSGTYTLLVPEDRREAGFTMVRLMGVALGKGLYRVKVERVGDA